MRKMHESVDSFAGQPLWMRIAIPVLGLLIAVGALVVPYAISSNATLLTGGLKVRYETGSIAEEDVRATETFHYIDEGETKRRRKLASDAVLPQFHVSLWETSGMLDDLDALFSGRDVKGAQDVQHAIGELSVDERDLIFRIVRDIVSRYAEMGIFDHEQLLAVDTGGSKVIDVISPGGYGQEPLHEEREITDVLTVKMVTVRAANDISILERLRDPERVRLIDRILEVTLRPNVSYEPVETALARDRAAMMVDPVVVRVEKGQYVVKRDSVITEEDLKTLQAMRLATVTYSPSQMIGRFAFVIIVTASALYAMQLVFTLSRRRFQYLLLFLVGVLLSEAAVFALLIVFAGRGFVSMDPFLPFFLVPILMALVTNRKRSGMIAAVLLGSYAVLLPFANRMTVFFVVAVAACGIYFIRFVSRRIDMIFQWFFGIISAAAIVMISNLFNGLGFSHVMQSLATIFANISVTYVLVTLLLPLLEWIGNFPTSFRLRELAYSDSPVLVRLSQAAVGTYNHSMMVAEMAYASAQEIGADSLLARVGALYHDIGKIEHPEYFIENQSGDNKHDDLKASLSVAIIKSHVKIGVEKGREARLPQEVLDIVSQHHGNDVIAVFWKEAQAAAAATGGEREAKQQDYAYHNQIPQTPEAAIVMLADSVEAASRSLKKPSAQKYERLVNQLFMGKIERKQLVACRLSMTDLDIMAKVFVQILTGRYHTRIEYPDEVQGEEQ